MVTETLIRGMYRYWRDGDGGVGLIDFDDYMQLTRLYADYTAAVDSGNWDKWPDFFTEECTYKLQPRENHERGFPLATLSFESKGC
jgi:salicylate 5-hydroxylase small subunit